MNPEETSRRLSYNIKIARVKRNLKQSYVAEMADISVKHLSNIENNLAVPSVCVAHNIASVFGLKIDDLLAEPDV